MASVVALADVSFTKADETQQLAAIDPETDVIDENTHPSTADDVTADTPDRERDGNAANHCDVTVRKPKRILHFCDGTLEEFSTDDEEDAKKPSPQTNAVVDPTELLWVPFLWYHASKVGNKALEVCDYIGEHLANLFGITSPKYSMEIDAYHKMKREEEEEAKRTKEENAGWQEAVPLSTIDTSIRRTSADEQSHAIKETVIEAPRY